MKCSRPLFFTTALAITFWWTACKPEATLLQNTVEVTPTLPATTLNYRDVKLPKTFLTMQGDFTNNNTQNDIVPNDLFMNLVTNKQAFGGDFNNFPKEILENSNIRHNPAITNEAATLGRVLFYDPRMSLNNSVSCGSCHHQDKAFSDGLALSTGFGGKITPRNSMAIVNVGFNNHLFWDSRESNLQTMVTKPIQNHIEMGMENMEALEKKLSTVQYYEPLFKNAFGTSQVTKERISSAVTQFLCSMVSCNAKFDAVVEERANYTPLEKMGHDIFFGDAANCKSCHAGASFSAPDDPNMGGSYSSPDVEGTANIGLDLQARDAGKRAGQFKIPSLRNIALTAPYMHDGRFKTLEEVVNHYSNGIKAHPNLDKKFVGADGSPKRLNLNVIEKQALIAFLHTLTDEKITKDEKFSDPFKY
jgi:cytochrome c peroxidase